MNRTEMRVLEQFKPGEWLSFKEVTQRYFDSIAADKACGSVSFIIALFSEERAKSWFSSFGWREVHIALWSLCEDGLLEYRKTRLADATIADRARLYDIPWEELDDDELDRALSIFRPEYRITEDGLRARMSKLDRQRVGGVVPAT